MSNTEHTLGDILAQARGTELEPHKVHQLEHTPVPVERMCAALKKQWLSTAEACEYRADKMEMVVHELRRRAEVLRREAEEIPVSIKETVLGEIESRHRVNAFDLVNPLD